MPTEPQKPRLEDYRAYLHILTQVLLKTSGPLKRKISASDVVQETLLKAHIALPQFQGTTEDEFTGWLRVILANKLTDTARHFSRQKRDVGLERSYRETLDESAVRLQRIVPAEQDSPSQHVARQQRICRLVQALDTLPQDQRVAVEMHHLMGYTVIEIATEMGHTRAGVAGLLRRGLKRLRESLNVGSIR